VKNLQKEGKEKIRTKTNEAKPHFKGKVCNNGKKTAWFINIHKGEEEEGLLLLLLLLLLLRVTRAGGILPQFLLLLLIGSCGEIYDPFPCLEVLHGLYFYNGSY
jgi:hypothetical protein